MDLLLSRFRDAGGLQIVSHSIQQLLERGEEDPRLQFIAFFLVSQIGEYVENPVELSPVITILIEKCKSIKSLVRFGCYHCLGQLSTDMAPKFQETYGEVALPALIVGMKAPILRVNCHAVQAICNFLAHSTVEVIANFVNPLMEAVMSQLSTPSVKLYKLLLVCTRTLASVNLINQDYWS